MINTCFKRLILIYINRNSEFNYLIDSLKQSYGINYISSDIINYINDNIFSNQEFIKVIYKECPSLFEKIYKTILSLKDNLVTKDLLIDVKSLWNKVDKVWSKIKVTKGNIPIDLNLLNKYPGDREIFDSIDINSKEVLKVPSDIEELHNIDINNLNITETQKLAKIIYNKYKVKSLYINDDNKILVSNKGIDESVSKIFDRRIQINLLKEHLLAFSVLGKIIEHAKIISQCNENKCREKYNSWNYYYDILEIDNNIYTIIFAVVSMNDGENHYRLQRIEKVDIRSTLFKME